MKPTKWILLTTLAALPLFSGNAHAQSGAPQAAPEDIVVTARRTEERLQDVPISISVFNQDQLAARNIVNSTDLATYTPSLAVNSRYGPEKAVFALRGFSQDPGTVPTVGVYFADVVAPRLVSNIASGNGAGPGSMFDLQDVQVLKGPQGTLFGKNTTGGAILLVPQRPTDKLGGYAEVSVGNYNMLRGQAVLNVPISDTFKIRLGIDRDKRDGYLINKSGIGPANFNDVNYLAARLGILANITPNLENYALVTYTRSHDHGTTGRAAFCSTAPSPFGPLVTAAACGPNGQIARDSTRGFYDVESSDPTSGEYIETWQAINTTTWKAADTLTVKNIASYGQSRESYSFNIIGDNLLIPTPSPNGTPLSYGTVATYPGPNGGQGDQWTATEELQLQGHSANNRLTWQTGGYMERSGPDKNQTQYAVVLGNCTDLYAFKCNVQPGGSIGIAHNDYYFHSYALYGQATYKLTEQFSVTGGIRNTWDSETERADNVRVSPSPTGPTAIACSRGGTPQLTPAPTPGAALLSNGACTRILRVVQQANLADRRRLQAHA